MARAAGGDPPGRSPAPPTQALASSRRPSRSPPRRQPPLQWEPCRVAFVRASPHRPCSGVRPKEAVWWLMKSPVGWLGPARAITLTGWLLLWLGSALAVLWLRETPMCWASTANGVGWVAGMSSVGNRCTSDIVDTTEGLLALICVVIGLVGMLSIVRGRNGDGAGARGSVPASLGPTHRHSNGRPAPSRNLVRDRLG